VQPPHVPARTGRNRQALGIPAPNAVVPSRDRAPPPMPLWLDRPTACPCELASMTSGWRIDGASSVARGDGRNVMSLDLCSFDVARRVWASMRTMSLDLAPSIVRNMLLGGNSVATLSEEAEQHNHPPPSASTSIVFYGDSTAQQQLRSLQCILASAGGTCATTNTFDGTASLHWEYLFGHFISPQLLKGVLDHIVKTPALLYAPRLIIVLCVGAWYNLPDEPTAAGESRQPTLGYAADLSSLGPWWKEAARFRLRQLRELRRQQANEARTDESNDDGIRLVLREPLPQHFPGSPNSTGTYQVKPAAKRKTKRAFWRARRHLATDAATNATPRSNDDEKHGSNVRGQCDALQRRRVNKVCVPTIRNDWRWTALQRHVKGIRLLGIGVVGVAEPLRDLWFAHGAGNRGDCTHYCVAAQYLWNAQLAKVVASLDGEAKASAALSEREVNVLPSQSAPSKHE